MPTRGTVGFVPRLPVYVGPINPVVDGILHTKDGSSSGRGKALRPTYRQLLRPGPLSNTRSSTRTRPRRGALIKMGFTATTKQSARMHALWKRYPRLVLSEQCGAVVPFPTQSKFFSTPKVRHNGRLLWCARVALTGHVLEFDNSTDTARHFMEPIGRVETCHCIGSAWHIPATKLCCNCQIRDRPAL
jgi:hypothetical protein